MKEKYIVKEIDWQYDDCEEIILPTDLDVPEEFVSEDGVELDRLSDWLSDTYGFLHDGFVVEKIDHVDCPYCQIKKIAKVKTVFDSLRLHDGRCDCGAFIDSGQHTVKINGYTDIYKGAVKLLTDMVDKFVDILDYYDVCPDEDEAISISTTEIIDRLFLPYYGGTTKCNFTKAIGIENKEHEWKLTTKEK